MRVSGRFFGLFIIVSLLIIAQAGSSASQQSSGGSSGDGVYLQNNIHCQKGRSDIKASYANWTDPGKGHFIVPVNTRVGFGKFRRGFEIKILESGEKIYFEYNSSRMGMSAEEYFNVITSPTKVNLSNFSEMDQQGIREGKAQIGMSKKAVRVSLGYPATHRTPSLEEDTWIYWRNRFRTMAVEFGNDGKVKNIRY